MGAACHKTLKSQNQTQTPPSFQNPPEITSFYNANATAVNPPINQVINQNPPPSLADPFLIPLNNKNNNMETSQPPERHKEFWELESQDEIFNRFISKEMNEALRKGQNISVIFEMIQFKNEEKELSWRILTKTIEDFEISRLQSPENLVKSVSFLKTDIMRALEEFNNRGIEVNVKEFRDFLELLVDFYQISYSFIHKTINSVHEKWWTTNKSDDFLEIYLIKFTEALEKIQEKLIDEHQEQESPQRNPKSFMNVDIEQEFKKVGVIPGENLWEDCEISEELEGIPLKVSSNDYVPKVKRKKLKQTV